MEKYREQLKAMYIEVSKELAEILEVMPSTETRSFETTRAVEWKKYQMLYALAEGLRELMVGLTK